MRLIDANVLVEDLTAMKSAYDAITLDGMIKALKDAPTIEVFPVGRWFMCDGKLVCTRCRKKAHQMMDENNCFYYIETPYCPNCGAEMH